MGNTRVTQTTMAAAETAATIGPYSRPHRLAKLDGRTREARYLARITAELVAHLGGEARVAVTQRYLIQRVASDMLRLELLDAKSATGTMSDHDGRIAHALRNSVRLALRDLGMRPAAEREPTVAEIMRVLHGTPADDEGPTDAT